MEKGEKKRMAATGPVAKGLRGSAGGRRTGGRSARGRRTRRGSVRGRRTGGGSAGISGWYWYCYYCSFLALLLPLLLPNLSLRILYFIVVVIDYRHIGLDFRTVIPVITVMPSMEFVF